MSTAAERILEPIVERLQRPASVETVYGEPIEPGIRAVVPIARVAYGFDSGGNWVKDDREGGSTAGLAVPGIASAQTKFDKTQFVGVSYDSYTHQSQGEGTARLTKTEDGLKGHLKVGGFTILVANSDGSPRKPDRSGHPFPEHTFTLDDSRFTESGIGLRCKVLTVEETVWGHLTRPHADYGRLGFTLGNPDRIHRRHHRRWSRRRRRR
jgi:hypothetical protein